MRLHRLRFTVRRLMVAVAAVGLALGLCATCRSRSQQYYALMMSHKSRAMELIDNAQPGTDAAARRRFHTRITWHEVMYAKYKHAARYPWLPVAPDPPEPE
jgi:hypothetical protein